MLLEKTIVLIEHNISILFVIKWLLCSLSQNFYMWIVIRGDDHKSWELFLSPGLATPVDLKLKLIPILQHMHHDAILASSARQLLQQLVTSYPSTKMVIVSLHTFTLLAASSLVDTPKQVMSLFFKLPFLR